VRTHPIRPRFSPPMNFTAVILAGGRSVRMGQDKAFLPFEGRPLIDHSIRIVRDAGAAEVLISGRAGQDFSRLDYPLLLDAIPDCGPLGGIEQALGVAKHPLVLVLAVDLPHMTSRFLRWLLESSSSEASRPVQSSCPVAGAVPLLNGRLEPLVAFYPRAVQGEAHRMLIEQRFAARDFAGTCIRQGWVCRVPVFVSDARCFVNWNTPADVTAT
jgi:molybdopterin-guanine dinucleotide biosynthesis protein A